LHLRISRIENSDASADATHIVLKLVYEIVKRHDFNTNLIDIHGNNFFHALLKPSTICYRLEHFNFMKIIFKEALNKYSDLNMRDELGNTPLHYTKNFSLLLTLASNGADLTILNNEGQSPFIYAVDPVRWSESYDSASIAHDIITDIKRTKLFLVHTLVGFI